MTTVAPVFTWDWAPDSLVIAPTVGTFTNVVTEVRWRLVGTDNSAVPTLVVRRQGSVVLGPPNSADFVAFASLTPAECSAWIEGVMPPGQLINIQNEMMVALDKLRNPPQTMAAPWLPPPPVYTPSTTTQPAPAPVGATT